MPKTYLKYPTSSSWKSPLNPLKIPVHLNAIYVNASGTVPKTTKILPTVSSAVVPINTSNASNLVKKLQRANCGGHSAHSQYWWFPILLSSRKLTNQTKNQRSKPTLLTLSNPPSANSSSTSTYHSAADQELRQNNQRNSINFNSNGNPSFHRASSRNRYLRRP